MIFLVDVVYLGWVTTFIVQFRGFMLDLNIGLCFGWVMFPILDLEIVKTSILHVKTMILYDWCEDSVEWTVLNSRNSLDIKEID